MSFESTGYVTAPDGERWLMNPEAGGAMTLLHRAGLRVQVPADIFAAASKPAAINDPLPLETKAAIGWIALQMIQATQGCDRNTPGGLCLPADNHFAL